MKCWAAFTVLLMLYVTSTFGQTIYDANNFYKPMTADYDVRLRGEVFLPPCIKNLLNCWEVISPDIVCKYGLEYRQALESMCMDMRFQCVEHLGPQPFETANVTVWNFCAPTRAEHDKLNRGPLSPGINIFSTSGWRRTLPGH